MALGEAVSAAACCRGSLVRAFCGGDGPVRAPGQADGQAARTPPSPLALRARRRSRSVEESARRCAVREPRRHVGSLALCAGRRAASGAGEGGGVWLLIAVRRLLSSVVLVAVLGRHTKPSSVLG